MIAISVRFEVDAMVEHCAGISFNCDSMIINQVLISKFRTSGSAIKVNATGRPGTAKTPEIVACVSVCPAISRAPFRWVVALGLSDQSASGKTRSYWFVYFEHTTS